MPLNPFLVTNHGAHFQDADVVAQYHLRLPYPKETFDWLLALMTDTPRTVLDVGTGTGEIARQLIEQVDRIDAVDWSAAMLARGKTLPGGDHPHLQWLCGRIEDIPLFPPYALITLGDSLVWLDWEVIFPRFVQLLTPHGSLAILSRRELPVSWQSELDQLRRGFSTLKGAPSFDIVATLERAHLFARVGEYQTESVTTSQTITDYIASFHTRSTHSHMAEADKALFDQQLRLLLKPWCHQETLELQTVAEIVWGRPL